MVKEIINLRVITGRPAHVVILDHSRNFCGAGFCPDHLEKCCTLNENT